MVGGVIAPRIDNGTIGQIPCSGRIYATSFVATATTLCDKSHRYNSIRLYLFLYEDQ